MKRFITGGFIATTLLFSWGYSTSASAAEYRTHPPRHSCSNTERSMYRAEFNSNSDIRELLNPGTVRCDVHRAAPLSSRGARAIIRFDTRGFERVSTAISCRFAAVNVWGREIFFRTSLASFTSGSYRSIVIALPRTIVNGTFRVTCTLPSRTYPQPQGSSFSNASYRFPSFTIIEL